MTTVASRVLAKIVGVWPVNSPHKHTHTWVFVENRRKCRDWRSSRKNSHHTPSPSLENSTYIYKPKPNRKNPAATALLERVKCFLCILLCVVLPAFCWRCCCSFRSCHLLCPCVCVCVCYATSALVCCCITMLQSQHTNVSHVVISVVVACFGLVRLLLRPLTPPPRTCVCLCFGALSLVKVWAFSPRKNESLEHLVLEFHRGYCAYFKSALPSVSPQSVNGVELCKFSSCRFSFLAAWIFRWPSQCVSFVV